MKFYCAEEYQASCEKLFLQYQQRIKEILPNAVVEHIGASSIPKAVSKGDLDIFVGVDQADLEASAQLLTQLGFQEKVDTLRTPELCMLESRLGEDVAIQVVAKGSKFENFLKFRDHLRANPKFVQQYNELKMSYKGLPQDQYRAKKSDYIEHVLEQADS